MMEYVADLYGILKAQPKDEHQPENHTESMRRGLRGLDEQLRQGGNRAGVEKLLTLLRQDAGKLLHGRDEFFASLARIQSLVNARKPTSGPPPTRPHHAPKASEGKTMRDQVFISYSHKDEQFLNELRTHLKPLERFGPITVWSDKDIQPGAKWFEKINNALAKTRVAVLLVSPDFLASDFIHQHELGPLLEEAKSGNVKILWVPIRASAYEQTPLKDYQALSPPEKPFAEMGAERDSAWVDVCKGIKEAVDP